MSPEPVRSLWDVAPLLRDGQLVPVLPDWVQEANIYATYPSRLETSAKVRVTVEFLQDEFARLDAAGGMTGGAVARPLVVGR